MRQFIVVALIASLGIWSTISKAGEINAGWSAFSVPVSSLKTESSPIYYRGLPLNADHPSMGYSDGQEAMATAEKFPDVLNCLSLEPEDETVSLARLNTRQFEAIADLEICLQRVGNEFGDTPAASLDGLCKYPHDAVRIDRAAMGNAHDTRGLQRPAASHLWPPEPVWAVLYGYGTADLFYKKGCLIKAWGEQYSI